jgi:hypothetical protein
MLATVLANYHSHVHGAAPLAVPTGRDAWADDDQSAFALGDPGARVCADGADRGYPALAGGDGRPAAAARHVDLVAAGAVLLVATVASLTVDVVGVRRAGASVGDAG